MDILKKLTSIRAASGDEAPMKEYILNYVAAHSSSWKVAPKIIQGQGFQDCVILIFGQPRTAIYAHMDSIGFTVGYDNELIRIGGPKVVDEEIHLVGSDSRGEIDAELMLIENEDESISLKCIFDREIDRGTNLTFKPNFRETDDYVQSPYLDNRLGVWSALKVAETLEHGAIVFSTYEEHGGNSIGFCAHYLMENYGIYQALVSDITWVTDGVVHGGGVAISMRDGSIPRRSYLNKILDLADASGIEYQLEVESAGGSDGTMLQRSHLPIDWLFIGAPEDHVHTPNELVYKFDIMCMVEMYRFLMINL